MADLDPRRERLLRQALWLEWLTVGWLAIEAGVAAVSGVAARSISLLAFGIDSLIELVSAFVLIRRLSSELQLGREICESVERNARRIGGALLLTLAAYVVAAAGWSLWCGAGQAFSGPGLAISVLAIPVMLWLARRKLALSDRLGSRALRTDAAESVACLWLSLIVVAGLIAQLSLGAWWIDGLASLAIVWFLVKEGREALAEEDEG